LDVPVDDLEGDTQPKKRRDMIAEKIVQRQKVKEERKRQKIREEREKRELKYLTESSIRWLKNWNWPDADGSSTVGDGSMEHEEEHLSEHGSKRCSQELASREVEGRHASRLKVDAEDGQTERLPSTDNLIPGEILTERARSIPSLQRYWSYQALN